MRKGRRLPRFWVFAALVALILGTGAGSGVLAESATKTPYLDAVRVDDAAAKLKNPEMPPAMFRHDKHTVAVTEQGMDCTACHNLKNPHPFAFRNASDKQDAGQLKLVFHDGCMGCHADFAKMGLETGPQDGECRLCHEAKARFAGEGDAVDPVMNKALHARHIASKAIAPVAGDSFAADLDQQNCGACHHVWDAQLKKLMWVPGAEDNCAACHTAKAEGNRPSIKDAVHNKCAGCHADMALKARAEKAASGKTVTENSAQETKNTKNKKAKDKPKSVWVSAVDLGTGPETCVGCHAPGVLTKKVAATGSGKADGTTPSSPRLQRGQPDAVVMLPVSNPGGEAVANSAESAATIMPPVLFDHKFHEDAVESCRICHHVRIPTKADDEKGCTVCHTVQGKQEGNFVQLSTAMHKPDSERSCVGCHRERVMERRECAGCHAEIKPMADKTTCASCHREVQGLPAQSIADGTAFKLDSTSLASIAQANLARKNAPVQALSAADMPETVRIGTLASEYEPAVMPHRKIYEALQKGIGNSALAGAFHTTPTATCAACHHNSPADGLRNPPKCSSCHGAQADKQPVQGNVPSLKAAYHQQCMACHERMDVKPVATDCKACHAERAKAER